MKDARRGRKPECRLELRFLVGSFSGENALARSFNISRKLRGRRSAGAHIRPRKV
jgi:hypothetical protein